MEEWRGGEARYGDESPETIVLVVGRELGLALAWREELRSGEPT